MIKILAHFLTITILAMCAPASLIANEDATGRVASDIPGAELVNSRIESRVGGEIVDQVYLINIPTKSVLIMTVSGEFGSEIGLYLFGADASSILTDSPIGQSSKPGGQQTLVKSFVEPTKAYININGRNTDRAYAYVLEFTLVVDSSPPVFRRLTIPAISKSTEFCPYVDVSDPTSGVTQIAIGGAGGEPKLFTYLGPGKYCAELSPGTKKRTILVSAVNGLGLTSQRAGTVTVDDDAPRVIRTAPADEVLHRGKAPISWLFDEPVYITGGSATLVVVRTSDGKRISGFARFHQQGRKIIWTPARRILAGSVILATLQSVSDSVGNVRAADLTRIISRRNKTSIRTSQIGFGKQGSVLMINISQNLVGKQLILENWNGSAWTFLNVITPSAKNTQIEIETRDAARLRLRYEGDERLDSSKSSPLALILGE